MDLLDRLKTRKGGCSSYSAVNDPYMLLDNAIVKSPATTTGGFKSLKDDKRRRRGGENNLNQEEMMMDGGAKRKRRNKRKTNKKSSKGGNPVSDFLNSFQNEKQTGGRHMRRGGYNEPASQVATNQPAPQVVNTPAPQVVNTPPQQSASNSLLGDAMGMLAKSANLSGITGGGKRNDSRRRGGTGVELAPFAAAVALLAARMLNDPEVRKNTKMGMGQSRRSSSKRRARA